MRVGSTEKATGYALVNAAKTWGWPEIVTADDESVAVRNM